MQWGVFVESQGITEYRYFPISFTTTVFGIWSSACNNENISYVGGNIPWAIMHSLSDMLVGFGNDVNNGGTKVYCIAIGY